MILIYSEKRCRRKDDRYLSKILSNEIFVETYLILAAIVLRLV